MASTYVNDLRLNEMATGDQSGSWGTVTNTNLELIGEAFSYGTEAITTNADTHTTTIADGASDPGRAMFLKYTGSLDSACTITIGPNTVSKMWFIENATSGSQNIIISQGSGANVTIAAGQTKAVYSDGAGAGAAFVDAFDSLSVGSLTSTGIDVTGTVTATEFNIAEFSTSTNVLQSNTGETGARLRASVSSAGFPTFAFSDDDNTGIFHPAADTLGFSTNASEAMRITSSGSVGIGTSSPDLVGSTTALTINHSGGNGQLSLMGNGTVYGRIFADNATGDLKMGNPTSNDVMFYTANTERMRIESGGALLVTSNDIKSSISGTYYLSGTNGNAGNPNYVTYGFVDDVNTGMYRGGADMLNFATGGSEAARIDSSGNLLVGTTTMNGEGITLNASNYLYAKRSGAAAGLFDRNTSDGDIVEFRKSGSMVGSIATQAWGFNFGASGTNANGFSCNGNNALIPLKNMQLSSGTQDIGSSTYKWKDAYFSGTVNAANFNTTSDATLKTNVETLTGSLDAVKSLRGVSFDWIENGNSEVGVIAQEVEAVLPNVVSTDDQGIKSVKYGNMVALLIEAMKEQQAQIDELKAKLGE